MRIRGFAPATPCWVELASTEPGRAQDFYAAVFGWEPAGDRFKLDGRAVAGLTRTRPGRPDGWLTYLASLDAAADVRRFTAGGGALLSGPEPAHGGHAAVVADPAGALLGFWQAADFAGSQVAGEPGTMAWPELLTDDPDAAAGFYSQALGWLLRDEPGSDGSRGEWITSFHDAIAGLAPGGPAARWRCAFQVADCGDVVARVRARGGSVVAEPAEVGFACYAELRDPFGASFSVAAPSNRPVEMSLQFNEVAGMELTFPG